jgi:hypothetical protein
MRTWLRGKITLLFLTCAVLLAIPAVAFADLVEDDVVVNGNDTIGLKADGNGGFTGSTTVNYKIVQQGTACEPSTGDDATVTINTPAGVTASPSTLTFNKCDTAASPASQSVTLTATSFAANGQEVSVSVADNDATGTGANGYNVNNAKFNLQVQKATGISGVSGSATEGGTANLKATLSSLYAASENMQGKNIQFKIGTTVVGTDATDSNGLAELSGVTLPAGFTAANTYNGAVTATFDGSTDTTYVGSSGTGNLVVSPACTNPADPTFSGTPNGDNGWYKTTIPTVSASSTAGATVQYSLNAAGPFSNTAPTLGQGQTTVYAKAVSGTCSSGVSSQLYKVDTIAPSINDDGTTQTPNGAGWFNTAVSNDFSASDATSGLPASFTNPFSVSSGTDEGSAVNINSGPVSDNAGNTNPGIDSAAFKIDMTDPVANCDSAPTSWSASDVSIRCQPTDALSGLANTADGDFNLSTSVAANTETSNASTNSRPVADAAGNSVTAGPITGLKVDKKAPVLTDEGPTTQPNQAGWYKSAVTNGFKATDGGSGFGTNGDLTKSFTKSSGTNEGSTVKIASDAVSDAVGNSAASIDSAAFKIDLSDPYDVAFQGGPAAGSYDFGNVPAKPTCTAKDDVSGLKSCEVTDYSTDVGTHTMTATATDNADRTATATRTYTVAAATTKGFFSPIDMNNAVNTVKGGSTVPAKFELFGGATNTEQKNLSAVSSMSAKQISCSTLTGATDAIEEIVSTSATGLRFDTTGDQFIYNWKTPKSPGTCYSLTMTAADNTTKLVAYFKLT